MLGYFKPIASVLTEEDKKAYRCLYCTLCHQLKEQYGCLSTIFIQHELLFILMCTMRGDRLPTENFAQAGCVLFPLKKVSVLQNTGLTKPLADISVFTVYTSYLNTAIDGKDISLKNKGFRFCFGQQFLKSTVNLHLTAAQVDQLKQLLKEETHCHCPPDQTMAAVCNFYADLIVQTLNLDESYREVAFQVCRIMYYLDALEDFQTDRKKGHFNILNPIYQAPSQIAGYVSQKVYAALEIIRQYSADSPYQDLVENILFHSVIRQLNVFKKSIRSDSNVRCNIG